MVRARPLKVALLGCGVVGSEVTRIMRTHADDLAARVGAPLELVGIAVRRPGRVREGVPEELAAAMLPEGPDDDVAILIARVDPPTAEESLSRRLEPESSAVANARHLVTRYLADRAVPSGVVTEAAEAMAEARFGLKAATVTPEGKDDVGSPNRILREAIGGKVIIRTGRRIPGVNPVAGLHHAVSVVRMAVGDAYGAEQWREGEAGSVEEVALRTERITRDVCRAVAEFEIFLRSGHEVGEHQRGLVRWHRRDHQLQTGEHVAVGELPRGQPPAAAVLPAHQPVFGDAVSDAAAVHPDALRGLVDRQRGVPQHGLLGHGARPLVGLGLLERVHVQPGFGEGGAFGFGEVRGWIRLR